MQNQIEEFFIAFWEAYPRRVGKKAAKKAFERALREGATPDEIMVGVELYKAWLNSRDTEIQFVKHPATYLNGGCWEDEYKLNLPEKKPFDAEEAKWAYRAKLWNFGRGTWYSNVWGYRPDDSSFSCPEKFKNLFYEKKGGLKLVG